MYEKEMKQLVLLTVHCNHIKLFLNQKQGPDFLKQILLVLDL